MSFFPFPAVTLMPVELISERQGVFCFPNNLMKERHWNCHLQIVNLCHFTNESFNMTQDENIPFYLGNDTDSLCFEIGLISCHIQCIVKIENTIHFLLLCQGLIPFTENMNISHSSVLFHILNCLSVIGGERKRGRDDLTQSPTFLHLSFCLLVLDYQLSPSLTETGS